ncbi:MAG: amidohydrolase family protein [Dermatophilaceae bacterium]
MSQLMPTTVIRDVRILPLTDTDVPDRPVDLLVRDGVVAKIGPDLDDTHAEDVVEAAGRWVAPALWDGHVHLTQWALAASRLDLRGAASVADALRRVDEHLAGQAEADRHTVVVAWGHRSASWEPQPTVAALDEVSGGRAVVLVSGDGHHGWLSSRALDLLGLPPRQNVVDEAEWFDAFARLGELPGGPDEEQAVRDAVAGANAKGLVGITDFELKGTLTDWPARVAAGIDTLRVRAGFYAADLDAAFATGLEHGMPLPGGRGLVTLGPLKIISDGSLNTRTAYCREPYADAAAPAFPYGKRNLDPEQMRELVEAAHEHDLESAVHAIGDEAVAEALEVFRVVGARGSIEHAQLMRWQDVPVMGRLGLRASVQPAHLLDDRDVTMQCWPDRSDRCFIFRRLLDEGIGLVLGSDAPVSPLDPWLAMAAAVHRSGDEREPWHPEQSLSPREALQASTHGHGTVGVGSHGDLVLLDADPLASGSSAERAERLRTMSVGATLVAGRVVYSRF